MSRQQPQDASPSRRKLDTPLFLFQWLKDPFAIGALAPSSQELAKLITSEIDENSGKVIELGGGTGKFTEWILKRGVTPQNLTVYEQNDHFHNILESRFPHVNISKSNAAALHLEEEVQDGSISAVVSGLPLLGMSKCNKIRILERSFKKLKPGGSFYQFTYSFRSPVSKVILDHLNLNAEFVGSAVKNVPPAKVFRFSKKQLDEHKKAS